MPVVLTFSLTPKERKDKYILAPYRNKLEKLDVKTIVSWANDTSHVVAGKRNTGLGLQALINGRHIVTVDYVDAIVAATVKPPQDADVPFSPLELDFEGNFPDPLDYLPPHANEPVDRPPRMFTPDERRKKLFESWTFIFCDERQYASLLAPILDAHGKAEQFKLEPHRTTPRELVDFAKKRGGEVAVVRFKHIEDKEWSGDFIHEVESLWVNWNFFFCVFRLR